MFNHTYFRNTIAQQEEVDKLASKSHVSSSTAKFSEEINLEEVHSMFTFLKNGPISASFCLFSSFSSYNFNNTNWKKHRLYAWDSNPGLKDGRRRQNHRTMAVLFRPNWYWHISKIGLLGSLSTGTPVGSIQVPAPIGSFTVNWFFKRTNMYLGTASDICNFYTCTTIS